MAETSKYPRLVDPDSRAPDMIARTRQSPGSDTWITIGLAWQVIDDSGNRGYNLHLHVVPTNWDGNLFLLPAK